MKNKFIYIVSVVGFVVIAIIALYFILSDKVQQPAQKVWKAPIPKTVTTTTTEVNGYTIEFIRSIFDNEMIDQSNKINITKDSKTLFAIDASQDFGGFYANGVGDWIKDADDLKKKAIKDVTGNGIPEMIIEGYSGGAHCCIHNYIIELSNPLSILFDLDTGDNGIEFDDLNKDGIMEIITREDVFAYWYTSFAGSPMPRVVLSLQNGKYKADPKYMRKIAPTNKEIKEMANNLESWAERDSIYPEIAWRIYAIDLIYSGNIASARKYVDLVWHYNDDGKFEDYKFKTKKDFWEELESQTKESPCYKDLALFLNL